MLSNRANKKYRPLFETKIDVKQSENQGHGILIFTRKPGTVY